MAKPIYRNLVMAKSIPNRPFPRSVAKPIEQCWKPGEGNSGETRTGHLGFVGSDCERRNDQLLSASWCQMGQGPITSRGYKQPPPREMIVAPLWEAHVDLGTDKQRRVGRSGTELPVR